MTLTLPNLPEKNAVFSLKLDTNLDMVKLANNTYFQLGVFMSSVMVVQTMGLNQSTYAVEFDHPLIQQLSSVKQGFDSVQSQQQLTSLPQIFNLLTLPLKSHLEDFSTQLGNPQPASTVLLAQSKRTNPTSNNQESYLANAQTQAKPPSLIYQVKQGDTITKIASAYQVSTNELIKLNQIPNSNVIFVNQRLQIPTTAIQNNQNNTLNSNSSAIANLAATTNSRNLPQLKSNKNIVPSANEDPYIANLRAEIDQLRAQYKQEQEQEQKVNGDLKAASLVSVTDQQLQPKAKSNPAQISTTAKLNSPLPQRNLKSNLIKQDLIALKLPPLSNPDTYLPNTFDGYAWPAEGVVTSGYGWRWGRMHQGIDIAAPIGTPIVAAAAGTVIGVGWQDGYGNTVKLQHLDGSVTLYGHNDRNLVIHGQQVDKGEQIAEMGNTGYSTGSHLHFEIHLKDQEIVDPITLLSEK
jgi:murein DD-endopeptidase MepM/ murein hydrolase activator NlpD